MSNRKDGGDDSLALEVIEAIHNLPDCPSDSIDVSFESISSSPKVVHKKVSNSIFDEVGGEWSSAPRASLLLLLHISTDCFCGFESSFDWSENLCPLVRGLLLQSASFPLFWAVLLLFLLALLLRLKPTRSLIIGEFLLVVLSFFSIQLQQSSSQPVVAEAVGGFPFCLQTPWPREKNQELRLPLQAALAGQQTTAPTAVTAVANTKDNSKATSSEFQAFISDLEASPPFNPLNHTSFGHGSNTSGRQDVELPLGKGEKTGATVSAKPSFAGLFSTNRKLTMDNKLSKFKIEDGTITLEFDDRTDVRAKLGFCIVDYITGKFPALQAIHALSKSWGASFQQHDSGWLVFRFARDDDQQRILAGGPYFIYGRPLILKAMSDCFEFRMFDSSWAILPSLPLECWHPNALGKIDFRLGTPIAMDSLTMRMERVSYARILVESITVIEQKQQTVTDTNTADGIAYEQPESFRPQTSPKGQRQSSSLRQKEAEVDSSVSSCEPDSPTSTQHLMSGTMAYRKLKLQLGGESPPPITMKIEFWNVRGFNRPLKHNGVAHLIKNNRFCLLDILETKLTTSAIARIIDRSFLGWCQTNNFDTIASGRILIIWNPSVIDLVPEDISPQVIHCRAKNKSFQLSFYILFTYGLYTVVHKRSMWEKLLELGQPMNMPWLILGDFNCVKSPTDKQLGATPTWYELKDFAYYCLSLGLNDAQQRDATLLGTPTLQLESDPENAAIRDSVGEFRKNAVFLDEAERHFYYQKAKLYFLKIGDRNTKFFHDMVKRNATKSSILAITKTDDSTITVVEVKQAIFYINDNKAPGPDGYSACFFKRAWHIVGDQVCTAVLDFFRSGRLLRQLNHSIIALVPKSDHCPTVADYRPISCCNVIYKAITKIIVDLLAPALEHLTDRCQATFVGGRSITNNIFLAQEMVRQYTRKRISPRCTINVDLHKAFDSLSALSQVSHGYGFPPVFIAWIMECVSASSFSVALNGSLHGFFTGKKGLRQGDPMSPALFIICMEYFSRLIKRKTTDSDFNFHSKCEKLKITHLLFVDDLMMFSRGDLSSVHLDGMPMGSLGTSPALLLTFQNPTFVQ
ncbi:UNVERIFIED_CONTAM: hypothetical protein Sangu_2730000 [Sesamum angustifolium]|uniref:Reverse transcriptase domain-containing protein n=1 Tax=Sesamum angustifolium TaxID=2727405 RepID=A0AAW2IXG1_9LAMI